ncbi:MAG: EpsG family protein [Selenomonadaceae bacterium]|nr:EpsG family protein [Selenomonadaceae bacterium]
MIVPFLILTSLTWALPTFYKNKEFNIFFITLFSIVICGTRDIKCGIDTEQYYSIYNQLYGMPFVFELEGEYELGFRLFAYITSLFSDDPAVFLFVIAAVTFSLIGIFIYTNTDENHYGIAFFLFVCLGMYSTAFNAVRQYLAIAIACNMLWFLRKDKYFMSLLIIIIAYLFHKSMVVLMPCCLLIIIIRRCCDFVDDKYVILLITVLSLPMLILAIMLVGGYWFENYLQEYMVYLTLAEYSNTSDHINMMMAPIEFLYLILIIMSVYNSKKKMDVKNVVTVSFFVLGSIFSFILMSTVALIFYRIEFIFGVYVCVLSSYYFGKLKNNKYKKVKLALVYIAGYVTLLWMLYTGYNGVLM